MKLDSNTSFGGNFSTYYEGLGSMGSCVVCERKTSGSLEFCKIHYRQFKKEITEKKPWIRVLKNDAQRERRRREKEFDNTSLDQIADRTYERDRYY